ncbi:GTPase activating protein (GAP) for Rho1p [Amphichorda felina]
MASAAPSAQPTSPPTRPAIPAVNPASPPNKRDLKSWWKNFRLPSKNQEQHDTKSQGIFGVPLRQSINYANVAISLVDEHGQSYIYGYVPIVVAKCGVFLKEKATGVEGIFRLSGSEKRIKELKTVFDSPDRYGKGLVWDGYTVHDAANVFRRYLNDLPEPVVPLDLYEKFREPLRGATKQAVGDAEGPQFVENFDEKAAIERYQRLITELPPLNRQLLLYILDLLAVFAAKSDENRMTSQNLAAIFQPGMLSHPHHAMAPEEYRLNQCVIIFLIENQDHFLIGMQGTEADEKTKSEVEFGGTPVTTPLTPTANRRSGTGVYRSSSNASAGAQSVLRDGQIRRNRSVNSRNSKREDNTTPSSPALSATQTGGLGRSNTVPSKKSPAVSGGKFKKHDNSSGSHSPAYLEALTPAHAHGTPRISEHSSLAAPEGGVGVSSGPGPSQERLLGVPQDPATPSKERNLPGLFQRSPADEAKRQPNKLKKKRLPGSMNHSAQSSSTSLQHPGTNISPIAEPTNPLDQPTLEQPELEQAQSISTLAHQSSDISSEPTPRASQLPPNSNLRPDSILKAKKSPPTSLNSSFNDGSDQDQGAEAQNGGSSDQQEKEKKSRWRISRAKKDEGSSLKASSSEHIIKTNERADASQTSFGSTAAATQRPYKSLTGETAETSTTTIGTSDTQNSKAESFREGKDESKKSPIGWIRNKYREAKETAEQRRNKSPPSEHAQSLPSRGKSLDIKRDPPAEKKEGQVEEKQPVIQEPTVPEEPHETDASKEIPEAPKENPETLTEIPEAPKENPEALTEILEVPKEATETPKETPQTPKETSKTPKETPQTPKEMPEVPKETPEALKEIPQAPKETPEVPKETLQVSKETSGVPTTTTSAVAIPTTELEQPETAK